MVNYGNKNVPSTSGSSMSGLPLIFHRRKRYNPLRISPEKYPIEINSSAWTSWKAVGDKNNNTEERGGLDSLEGISI